MTGFDGHLSDDASFDAIYLYMREISVCARELKRKADILAVHVEAFQQNAKIIMGHLLRLEAIADSMMMRNLGDGGSHSESLHSEAGRANIH